MAALPPRETALWRHYMDRRRLLTRLMLRRLDLRENAAFNLENPAFNLENPNSTRKDSVRSWWRTVEFV